MAIVKMKKFNLYSFESKRNLLMRNLQKFKYVHFNDLESENEDINLDKVKIPESMMKIDEDIVKADWAISTLKGFEEKKSSLEAMKEGRESLTLSELKSRAEDFPFEDSYNYLYGLNERESSLLQKVQNIDSEVKELMPWKDIPYELSELRGLRTVEIMPGSIATKYLDGLRSDISELEHTTVEVISSDNKMSYIVIISDFTEHKELEIAVRKNGFSRHNFKIDGKVADRIDFLEKDRTDIFSDIEDIKKDIKGCVKYLNDFRLYYEYLRNKKLRIVSSENFLKTKQVDIIEGYIPADKEENFITVLDDVLGNEYFIDIKDAESDDRKVPIILENNAFARDFESLTDMYSLPKYDEIDPTPLFAPFYCIFAGIMVGDLAYGLLLFLATLFALKKFNLDNVTRKFIKFFNYLGISTMAWGIVFGSFFGDVLPMKALIDPATDYTNMIIMSLVFGVIHIFFALGIKAYMDIRDHKPLDALYDVGFWYIALVTVGIMVVDSMVESISFNPGIIKVSKFLMLASFVGIILTGGRENKSKGEKIAWGVYSLYGITGYLGDLVSYLRLMALALSGSFIAIAVNIIVRMLFEGGVLGIVFGIIIFVIFQLFNMFLSFLSAYVHSARLTYVEMFNKFYEGGGVPFRTMVEKSKYYIIKEE